MMARLRQYAAMSGRSTAASNSPILLLHGLLAHRVDYSHHPKDGG